MKIAIMGTRGIPANYGGFETFAEELSTRLVDRGHDVWVYCRTHNVTYPGSVYRGVNLVKLPTIGTKYLDTVVHTFLSVWHGAWRRYDAILVCNAANAVFCVVPRLFGEPVVLNVDGIERLRKKWGLSGRLWYHVGERLATIVPNRMVSDAAVIEQYYLDKYGAESVMIPYGATTERCETTRALVDLGVEPGQYILYVSRLEPENNAHLVVEAFAHVDTDMKLVVVGDAPYASEYKAMLVKLASEDPRVLLAGFVFGDGYRELQSHAAAYVQATEVGGTHPALIEAMGAGNAVLVNGTPENVEVLGEAGVVFEPGSAVDLASRLQSVLDDSSARERLGQRAAARVASTYSWDAVVSAYEDLFVEVARGGMKGGPTAK
ncbi:MAG: glycosyltransferase [Coriobacteriia bacterium]|nr:glycosyltransferase [Coriobacteriia bacterium]